MVKGAVLIGCGFVPTEVDMHGAIRQGYVKHCNTISVMGLNTPVPIERVLTVYTHIARAKGWTTPTGLQAMQFTASDGQPVWSIYPLG